MTAIYRKKFDCMRTAGKIVSETLQLLKKKSIPGIATSKLDDIAKSQIDKYDYTVSSFKGYRGYPAHVCVSINDAVVHGIPSDRVIIEDGDLVSIDFAVSYKKFHADAAITFVAGESKDTLSNKLIDVGERALYEAIGTIEVGNRIGDVSYATQKVIEENGFRVCTSLVGHAVGSSLHMQPQVPSFGTAGCGPLINPGIGLAIEPMVLIDGSPLYVDKEDGFTIRTMNGKRCSHFEHTVLVHDGETEIITNK